VLVALLGAAVVAGGVILLPLPGPGWLIIFLGLGIWASEFRWAGRLLRWVRDRFAFWSRWLARWSPLTRRLLTGLVLLVIAGAVAAGYLAWRGVPAWVPDWVPLPD
jgi:uncharacterized protein (TIGR02611 family)